MLRLDGATVRFGERAALDAVDLEVADHEIVCVLGPSGSGKSTLLRAVAGLQALDGGRVLLGGADQDGVPVHRRGVGLMFQDHQLFPQRDVGGNVAFGLRMRGRAAPSRPDGSRSCSTSWVCRTPSGGPSPRCPAASSSGWHWPAPWRPGPGCSCWTNPSGSSTGDCGNGSWWSCGSSSGGWERRSSR